LGVRISAGLDSDAIDDVIVHGPDYARLRLNVEDVKKVVHWFPDVELIHGGYQNATGPLEHSQCEVFGQSRRNSVVIMDQWRRNPMMVVDQRRWNAIISSLYVVVRVT